MAEKDIPNPGIRVGMLEKIAHVRTLPSGAKEVYTKGDITGKYRYHYVPRPEK